jgi:putative NADH-flavin reductase
MRQIESQKQRIAVLGATGGTGRAVIAAGLARGHDMIAVTRRAGAIASAPNLTELVWPDITSQSGLSLDGVDAVISTLGGEGSRPTTVCTDAMRSAVPAMTRQGVARLVVVSAHGAGDTRDRSLYSLAVWAGVGEKMKDKESMEPIVTASTLDWTIVRPPALKNTARTGGYRASDDLRIRLWHSIGREDLADLLIDEVERPRFVRKTPSVRR